MGKIKLFLKAIKSLVRKRRIASLWKSSLLLKKAIEEAEEKNKQDGRRYFVIWDPAQQKLISITYDYYKDRWDSYKYLLSYANEPRAVERDVLLLHEKQERLTFLSGRGKKGENDRMAELLSSSAG